MDDFEVHPVGTVRGLLQCIAELEQRLIADNPLPHKLTDDEKADMKYAAQIMEACEELPIMFKKQCD